MSAKLQQAYEQEEQQRRKGTLKVLDSSQLPPPRDSTRLGKIKPISTQQQQQKQQNASSVKIVRRKLTGFGNALGLDEDPVETIVVPLKPKRKLADLIGTGSYPKPIRDQQLGPSGVGLEQRRRQFLSANRGADKSQNLYQQ